MGKPDTITTPNGDRMVILPLAEYERLVEAANVIADIRSYDEAKRRVAAGEEELIPAEFVNRILDGDNKIRVWRDYRGMTVKQLATAAGIAPAYLSQIETGVRGGRIDIYKKLAAALRVDIDDIA